MSNVTTFGDLQLRFDEANPQALRVDLEGRSNSREPGKELVPYFSELIKRAVGHGGSLDVHFEKLDHFNSSTISALIQVINSAHDQKVRLRIVYDGAKRWQALSFDALKRALRPFDSGDHGVEFVSRAA